MKPSLIFQTVIPSAIPDQEAAQSNRLQNYNHCCLPMKLNSSIYSGTNSPGREMTMRCLSQTGTASLRAAGFRRGAFFLVFCNSLQSGVNFSFRGAQRLPFSLFLGTVLMKGVKHLCRWPRRAPLSARARPTSARAAGTGTAPAGAAGDGRGCILPWGSSTCHSLTSAENLPQLKSQLLIEYKKQNSEQFSITPFCTVMIPDSRSTEWENPPFFLGEGRVRFLYHKGWVPEQGGSDTAVPELGIFGAGWQHCWAAWLTSTLLG